MRNPHDPLLFLKISPGKDRIPIYDCIHNNAPVICITPLRAPDTGDKAGLKCPDLAYDVSPQCRGCAGVYFVCSI